MALTELARFLPRGTHHNRYLRSGMRPHHRDDDFDRQHVEPGSAATHEDASPAPPALKDPND
jgi:putative (di)nucleoside polyphosphate hydrolase